MDPEIANIILSSLSNFPNKLKQNTGIDKKKKMPIPAANLGSAKTFNASKDKLVNEIIAEQLVSMANNTQQQQQVNTQNPKEIETNAQMNIIQAQKGNGTKQMSFGNEAIVTGDANSNNNQGFNVNTVLYGKSNNNNDIEQTQNSIINESIGGWNTTHQIKPGAILNYQMQIKRNRGIDLSPEDTAKELWKNIYKKDFRDQYFEPIQ